MNGSTYHIFTGHLLHKQNDTPEIRHVQEQVWPSMLLLFCLGILVLIRVRASSRVQRIVQSTFSNQILQQLEREEINAFRLYSLALSGFFLLNLTFVIYKLNEIYRLVLPDHEPLARYSFFLAAVITTVSAKGIVNRIIAACTGETRVVTDYITNSTLINQTFGLFVFPFVILMEFSTFEPIIFIYCAFAVLATGLLIKWYRGLTMGLVQERIGLLQIFSYFCGLEILPVFVLVKYIIETF